MASRRLSEVKVLKNQDKPRNIINKKPDYVSGWHSANTSDVNDLVAWMSVKTKGDSQQSSSSTTISRDSYRHGYGWCSGLGDKELFRRHSLSEHYREATRAEQTRGDNANFCECPPLKDDGQRKSLDILVKSLNSQLPGGITLSSFTLKTTPTTTEKQLQLEAAQADRASQLIDLAGKFSSKASESSVAYSNDLRDDGNNSTKASIQEAHVNEVKIPKILNTSKTPGHDSENFSNKSTALSLPWLSNSYSNELDSPRKSLYQTQRQLGDVPGVDGNNVLGGPNSLELTPGRNYKAKLVYSKKETTIYESIDEDRKTESTKNFHHPSKVKSRLTEVSLQQISSRSLSLHQNNNLFSADKRSRKISTNFESQNITNQQSETNLVALSSLEPKDSRPRLLVLRKISIQDSSETGDDIMSRLKDGPNQNRLSFSVLTPLKVHKHKKDTKRMSSNVLVYQNDLLKSDKLSVPWIKPEFSEVNKNLMNPLQSNKTFDLPSSQLRFNKDLQDLPTLQKSSKTLQSLITNEAGGKGDINLFNHISNAPRPDLQYLGQQIRQNDALPRRLSTQKFPEGSVASTDVAMATASCEDLCSLPLLNLFHDDISRCTSVPVEPQLSIPRGQGFRPYNSMSPLQRAKSISFRRLHGYVAHLPDGSKTFKITAPNLPSTRIDRQETAKKLNRA